MIYDMLYSCNSCKVGSSAGNPNLGGAVTAYVRQVLCFLLFMLILACAVLYAIQTVFVKQLCSSLCFMLCTVYQEADDDMIVVYGY
jgi:hypothetical protein